MVWELVLWLVAFVAVISLIGLSAYQVWYLLIPLMIPNVKRDYHGNNVNPFYFSELICLSDLEYDYINPYDSSSRINAVVTPEFIVQGILCILFLLTWHWFPFLIMAPVTYYHIKLYMRRKHLIDVTEIFRALNEEKKYRFIKLGFYCCIFIIVIYRLVTTAVILLIDDDEWKLESGMF